MNWTVGQIKRVVVNDIGGHEFIDVGLLPGLNLITGGNGSGKSSLVSAIALLCGWNGRKAGKDTNLNKYIRIGASKGVVRIHFSNNDSKLQKGYLNDVYGDEIIVERTIYLKGTSNYTFRGSKTNSPIHTSLTAKSQLSKFRSYANIIINSPVTFLTQTDAKYLIREQNSPKSLYDFFQRVHFFDYSWERLAEEQRYIERAETISKSLNSELKHLESELSEYRSIDELVQSFNKLCVYEKCLDSINILNSIKILDSAINSLRDKCQELNETNLLLEIDCLNEGICKNDLKINKCKSELDNLKSEYEISFDKHKLLCIELEKIREMHKSHSENLQDIQKDIINTKKEISLIEEKSHSKSKEVGEKIKNDLLEEIRICKEKALALNNKKENLITLSIKKKNEASVLYEEIKEKKNKLNFINNEKLSFELQLNEIKRLIAADRVSLESINCLGDLHSPNSRINEQFSNNNTVVDSSGNHFNSAFGYSKLYKHFTDNDFEAIFGYSKSVHNRVIKQLEKNGNDINVQGPIALYIFSKPDINEKMINILDEIIGGRLETQDTRSGYRIRRNYKYWLVQNSKAKWDLICSFKNSGFNLDPSLIFIRSSFNLNKYDLANIRKRYPSVGLPVIDLVHVESNEVFNFLVDNFQIETTFIFLNDQDMDLIYDYNFNIRRAHSLSNYSFKYRRGGIVVAPEVSINKPIKQYKMVLRQPISFLCSKKEDGVLFASDADENNNFTERRAKKLLEYNLLENGRMISEIEGKIAEIDKNNSILEHSISININKAGFLRDESSKLENELDEISREEHLIKLKTGELELELMKLNREKYQHSDIKFTEMSELLAKLNTLNSLFSELEEKVNAEENLKKTNEANIENISTVLDHKRGLIKLKEDEHKSLKTNNDALLNKKILIENKLSERASKIQHINSEINSKVDELSKLKLKYAAMMGDPQNNEYQDIENDISSSRDICSTLDYINWNYNLSEGIMNSLPDTSTTESWKSTISRQKDTVYIDIIERSKGFGIEISENHKSENLFDQLLRTIQDNFRKYETKIHEYKEENDLLKKNKSILNKRIQQLQKNHIRCGRNVNSYFKHYFSIFWSNTMRPHLKFDHEKSSLSIYVIPDTASIKKSNNTEDRSYSEQNLGPLKDQHKDFVNREIQSLSGGESSSIGISLLLALSQNTPSPFHLFDEPDVYMDEIRRMTTIQSLIEFERKCSIENGTFNKQVLFITPHCEIVPHIKDNYSNLVHIVQLIKI
ncbi:Smc ABC ATPase [Cryptosporidium canis]|uniref:Smc ABC ATPase n=1 Tax=Cryptosporidium canis TaxID=195482 RepID=A0A9D5DKS1_9CRYT|nr:Smc ABC ATPase [Cryptosporidium canis]